MIPADATLTRRILRHYDSTDGETRARGRGWYTEAQQWCEGMGGEYGYPAETVAAVAAVLSPRVHWRDNLTDARLMLETSRDPDARDWPTLMALGANVAKAGMILNGADPATIVRGPKVTAFWRNLCGDPRAVTVDVWAARAAGINADALGVRAQRAIYSAYERAARRRDETPSAMQAIVWIAARGSAE